MSQYLAYGAMAGAGLGYALKKLKRRNIPTKVLAQRNAQKIRRIQNGSLHELKTHDSTTSDTPNTTGLIVGLTLIAQGDTSLSRDGLQIMPKNLQFKIRVVKHGSATNTQVRIIIFKDKEQGGTLATVADLLEGDGTLDFTEHDTRPRFQILRDLDFIVQTGSETMIFRKGFIKLRGKIWFGGTSAAQTSQGKNNIYFYIVSSEATNLPSVIVQARLRFHDN